MLVKDELLIQDLQKTFNLKFPYLKIEFYQKPHHSEGGSPKDEKLDVNQTIGAVRTVHHTGELSIHGNQKISTLEQAFQDQYGLFVQVFRKSANLWLQTTKTDHWTLTEANKKGEHSVRLTADRIYLE